MPPAALANKVMSDLEDEYMEYYTKEMDADTEEAKMEFTKMYHMLMASDGYLSPLIKTGSHAQAEQTVNAFKGAFAGTCVGGISEFSKKSTRMTNTLCQNLNGKSVMDTRIDSGAFAGHDPAAMHKAMAFREEFPWCAPFFDEYDMCGMNCVKGELKPL